MNVLNKFQSWYRNLPEKKRYIEFFTAILTVPVLLTVIILNITSLRNSQKKTETNPEKPPSIITIVQKEEKQSSSSTQPSSPTASACKKTVGPVKIIYPSEDETVDRNPVCIEISYPDENYCSVVWSYRINNEDWSDYTDKSICIYNLPPGEKQFELRVKSVASGETVLMKRVFTVAGSILPTTSTGTDSANLE